MPQISHDETIVDRIIKAFYAVYNAKGFGFLEAVYHRSMLIELQEVMRLPVVFQARMTVRHRGYPVGDYIADLVVDDRVVVECKSVEKLAPAHVAQVMNYLKATNFEIGLILNFGPEPRFRRINRFVSPSE